MGRIELFTKKIGIENQKDGCIDAWMNGKGKNKNKEIDYFKNFEKGWGGLFKKFSKDFSKDFED